MSLLLRALRLATALALTVTVGQGARSESAPSAQVPPASLVGLSRDEVVAARGKPTGERARADGSVLLVYADGAKIELREGRVVSVTGVGGGEIVGADGTRYTPGADGNIKRPVQVSEPTTPQVAETAATAPAEAETAREDAATEDAEEKELPPGAKPPPSVDGAKQAAAADAADEADEFEEEEEPELPLAGKVASFLIEAVLRFGLVVLVLRIALNVVGVPFLWPDLLKVALFYLAVHEVMSALGALGGLWEFVPLFRLDSIVGFIALACSLTWFKIAGSGLTAIKIAVATGLVMYFLMLGIGVAIALVMPSLLG